MLNDKGSERAILAGICQYGVDVYFDIVDILNTSCFSDVKNQILFSTLEYLFSNDIRKIDVPILFSAFNSLKHEEQIRTTQDQEYIRSLFNYPISIENVRPIAIKIVKLALARKSQGYLKEAYDNIGMVSGDEEIEELFNLVELPYSKLLKDTNTTEDEGTIGQNIEEHIDNRLNNPVENVGIPSPFPIFNKCIGDGLRTGVHLVASRFKVGKSTIGKTVGLHVSKNLDIPVLFVDSEMAKIEQLDRIIVELANIDIGNWERGKINKQEEKQVKEAAKIIKTLKFTHKRVSGRSFKEILGIMRRWINHKVGYNNEGKTNPHLIIYDYFKLMDTNDLNKMQETQAMGFQIAAMHDFCMEYETPVLAFVQTNRDGISGDSTSVIAQSDRLGWNAVSISLWKRKTPEEIAQDHPKNGTHKMIPLEGRFMKQFESGDYINFYFDGSRSIIKELNTRNQCLNGEFKHEYKSSNSE